MNKSFIVGLICSIFKTLGIWFENSAFKKLQTGFSKLWANVTEKSAVATYFKNYPKCTTAFENSVIYKSVSCVFRFFERIFKRLYVFFSNTYIVGKILYLYRNFFSLSVRAYGMALICFSSAYALIQLLFNRITPIKLAVVGIAVVFGLLSVLVNKSLLQLFGTSKITGFILSLFDMEIKDDTTTFAEDAGICRFLCVAGVISAMLGGLFGAGALLVLAGIIGASVLVYNYKIGIIMALLFMPFLPTMAVVGLALLSFVAMVLKLLISNKQKFVSTPLDFPIALFIVIMGISAVTSFARGNSVNIFLVYLSFALSYYTVTNTFKTKKQLFSMVIGMLFAGLMVAIYGIYQHIFGFAGADAWIDKDMFEDISTRVISTFGNPNVLGEYLLLLIPVCAGYLLARKGGFQKTVTAGIVGALCLCMIYTYSRGNWVGLMVAMVLYFMFYDSRFVWFGMVLILFAPLFVPQTIVDRLFSIGNTSDSSTSYRVYIWLGTIAMLKDYWLCGIGLGSEAYNLIYPFYSFSGIVAPHSHNLYLQILTENGIVGIVCFVAIIIVYYKGVISTAINTKCKMLKATLIGLSAGMFGYLVQGMFDNVWYNYRIVFMFYIIVALTMCAVNIARGEKFYD